MRSISFTLLLLLLTTGIIVMVTMSTKEGGFDGIFGKQATPVGSNLYHLDNDEIQSIHRILLSGNGVQAEAVFEKGIWHMTKPWNDRMDPRASDAILQFTLGTRVEDIIPEGKLDTAKAGLREGTIGIRIDDGKGNTLAKYLLGRKTEWTHRDAETKDETPTVFIQPLEGSHGNFTYASTGDIHPIFKDGFRHLRDHHPFLFNPDALQSVRFQGGEDGLLLSRTDAKSPWRITNPMELRTDPDAIKKLIPDLVKLRALRVADRSEVTLPSDDTKGRRQIAIRHFGQAEEVILEIYPPKTPEADTTFATVSDRPGTVFELPMKPIAPGLSEDPKNLKAPSPDDTIVSLAGLPDTVDELRNPMLTNIDVTSLQGILIVPSTGQEIFLGREKGAQWQYKNAAGRMDPLNEFTLARLLRALTQTKVVKFVSDAAANLAPYGLDRPSLSLRFVSFGNDGFELIFGRALDGTWYAMRTGVPTVMKLDDQFIREIGLHPWDWRHPSVWSIPQVDLTGIERTMEGRPPLLLEYRFLEQSWKAKEGDIDRSAELVTDRANQLLKLLVDLQCETWLAPDDPASTVALARPALRFSLAVKTVDDNGDFSGVVRRVLLLAPASDSPDNRIFYGRIDNDPHAFILRPETVLRLAVDLFGDH